MAKYAHPHLSVIFALMIGKWTGAGAREMSSCGSEMANPAKSHNPISRLLGTWPQAKTSNAPINGVCGTYCGQTVQAGMRIC